MLRTMDNKRPDRWAKQCEKSINSAGLTDHQFAVLAAVNVTTLRRWFRGEQGIQTRTLERVEKARLYIETRQRETVQKRIKQIRPNTHPKQGRPKSARA